MSIVLALECDVCGSVVVLGETSVFSIADGINLMQPYGVYKHVCNACHNDLERERLDDEAQEWGGVQP
jgi:hypothetical protein